MDITLITSSIETVKGALGIVKSAKEIAEKHHETELLGRLNEVQMALNDLIGTNGELIIEFTKARSELETLKSQLQDASLVETHYNLIWRKRGDGSLEGPFSPLAWGKDRKLILMTCLSANSAGIWFTDPIASSNHSVPSQFLTKTKALTDAEIAHFRQELGDQTEASFSAF